MNANELLDAIGDAKGAYVWEAQRRRTGEVPKAKPLRRTLLIAALIAMLLMLVGCAVVYVMRLQDMKIGEYTTVKPEHYGPNWMVIEAEEKTYELISLQGFADSPNQKAFQEWWEYLQASGVDLAEITGEQRREMNAKLNEIMEKYGLKPLSESITIDSDQIHILLNALQLSGICTEQDYAEVECTSGCFYPEGTFELNVNISLDKESFDWPYLIYANFQYYRKGYFMYYYIGVENLSSFQEWEYALPDGGKALLALGEDDALILVEQEDAYIAVHFDAHMGVDHMTPEMVEKIAALFDFSIVPHSLSGRETWEFQTLLKKLEDQQLQEYQQRQKQYEQALKKEGFDGWVKETLESSYAADLGYAFLDIDGNGVEELLIGRDGYPTAIYIEQNGTTELLNNAYFYMYPCKDNKMAGVMGLGTQTEYYLRKSSDGVSQIEAHIRYVPGCPDGEYWRYDITTWNQYDYITKEEFDSILNSYVRIPVKFLPLTEYPLEEKVVPEYSDDGLYSEGSETYEDKIRIRLTDMEERWSRWAYDIRDLNGDGIDEMVWREDDCYFIYTIRNGKVSGYSMVSDGSLTVCENGIVEAVYHYGPVNRTYRYYRLEEDRAVLVDYLRYDVDANPDMPWHRSPDLTGQDITLESISTVEAMSIIASYAPLELDMKPIAEYPFS